eukprot:TRINITY_DN2957_c1_g1_i1.p1 TRINITY_DN2957_c1_g1~~TRINITY_DN2957_c1_g1_i1.p1  ORF type:complete len:855 (+),score=152.73 TRINITY_DN2957_c1_g1_i1:90-2567(+)
MAPQQEGSFLEETVPIEHSDSQKNEMLRLIQQLLQGMGLPECADLLRQESGVELESEIVTKFRQGIQNGNWDEAKKLALAIDVNNDDASKAMQRKLATQQYLELLAEGSQLSALNVLQDKITPVSNDESEIVRLSSLLTCTTEDDLKTRSAYCGAEIERQRLAVSIQSDISANTMLEQDRLWELALQATQHQAEQCTDIQGISTLLRDCSDELDCSRASKKPKTSTEDPPDLSQFIITHGEEMTRLVLQLLRDSGYTNTFNMIEKETGVHCESPDSTKFRSSIESGDWDTAIELLPKLTDEGSVPQAAFLIGRQRYLEHLENGDAIQALTVLQEHVSPYCRSPSELHSLATLLTCCDISDLSSRSAYTSVARSRKKLVESLHSCIDCSILMEHNRLWKLVGQAQQRQREQCISLNRPVEGFTLLRDYTGEGSDLPKYTMVVLRQSDDEVWCLQFSPDGNWLSCGCRDGYVILHDVGQISKDNTITTKRLLSHKQSVTHLSFSSDSEGLLSASTDTSIKYWKTSTGELLRTFSGHLDPVLSVRWLPSGDSFFSSSEDRSVYKWCIETGELQRHWVTPVVLDMTVTPCGKSLITIDSDRQIICYNLEVSGDYENMFHKKPIEEYSRGLLTLQSTDNSEPVRWIMQEREKELTTCELSDCGRYLLCGISVKESRGCSHLYDLHLKKRIQKYVGAKQLTHVIRPIFGGHYQRFVLSGSEDGRVIITHRKTGKVISTLTGHLKSTNSVAWNPVRHDIIASCSDDTTVRIWSPAIVAAPGQIEEEVNNHNDPMDALTSTDDNAREPDVEEDEEEEEEEDRDNWSYNTYEDP